MGEASQVVSWWSWLEAQTQAWFSCHLCEGLPEDQWGVGTMSLACSAGEGGGAQHLDGTGRAQGPSPTPTPRAPSDRSRRPLCQMTPRRCPRASLRWPRMESWAPLEGAHLPSRTSALPPWDVRVAALGPSGPWGVCWFAGGWGPWTWRDGGGGAGVHGAVRLRRDQAVPKARMLQRTRGSDARGTSRAEA